MNSNPEKNSDKTAWYNQDFKQALDYFNVSQDSGLSSQQAKQGLNQYGRNQITSAQHRRTLHLLASQFSDLMILVLIGAAAVSGFVGELSDAIVIMVIVFLNAIIGFGNP